jgi:hypothetical protein
VVVVVVVVVVGGGGVVVFVVAVFVVAVFVVVAVVRGEVVSTLSARRCISAGVVTKLRARRARAKEQGLLAVGRAALSA